MQKESHVDKKIVFVLLMIVFYRASESHGATEACRAALRQPMDTGTLIALEDYAMNYANFLPPVQKMLALGKQIYQRKEPKGYCYRAVKDLLVRSGLLRRPPEGTWARSAHTRQFLARTGFIDLLTRPPFQERIKGALDEAIPIGAILVYDGTNGENGLVPMGEGIGHIEIKCGPNCYLFDTINEWPGGADGGQFRNAGILEAGTDTEQRRLIGVYIFDYFNLF